MKASQNLFALFLAYDLLTPDVDTNDDFRDLSQLFIDKAAPYERSLSRVFDTPAMRGNPMGQFHFDVLLSIAMDVGIDFLYLTKLPDLVTQNAGKTAIHNAIRSIPSFTDILRPDLVDELSYYHLPIKPRRLFEAELYSGKLYFAVGRHKNLDGTIHFGPYVLNPFYHFLAGKG